MTSSFSLSVLGCLVPVKTKLPLDSCVVAKTREFAREDENNNRLILNAGYLSVPTRPSWYPSTGLIRARQSNHYTCRVTAHRKISNFAARILLFSSSYFFSSGVFLGQVAACIAACIAAPHRSSSTTNQERGPRLGQHSTASNSSSFQHALSRAQPSPGLFHLLRLVGSQSKGRQHVKRNEASRRLID